MNALSKEYGQNQPMEVQLQVSRYDQVASMLVSLLILVGLSVMLLAFVWLTTTLVIPPPEPIIISAGRAHVPNNSAGFEQAMAMPGMDELPELSEPLLTAELESVSAAASTVAALIIPGHRGSDDSKPTNPGPGDGPDSNGPDDDIIPRWERWQIRWTSTGLQAYIRQLDFFKIELGAAGGKAKLDYAFNLSKVRPDTREGTGSAEKRLYMTWKGGKLIQFP